MVKIRGTCPKNRDTHLQILRGEPAEIHTLVTSHTAFVFTSFHGSGKWKKKVSSPSVLGLDNTLLTSVSQVDICLFETEEKIMEC